MSKTSERAARKQLKTSNTVLIVLGVFLLVFIITMTIIFCVKGSTPDTLIQYVLGAGGLETLALALIKISKVFAGEKVSLDSNNEMNEIQEDNVCG